MNLKILKSWMILFATVAATTAAYADQEHITVRTQGFGSHLVAVSEDYRVFGIVCHGGLTALVTGGSADLVFPTSSGELTIESYRQTSRVIGERSSYLPLTSAAVQAICSHKAGEFDLVISGKAVDVTGQRTVNADAFRPARQRRY